MTPPPSSFPCEPHSAFLIDYIYYTFIYSFTYFYSIWAKIVVGILLNDGTFDKFRLSNAESYLVRKIAFLLISLNMGSNCVYTCTSTCSIYMCMHSDQLVIYTYMYVILCGCEVDFSEISPVSVTKS